MPVALRASPTAFCWTSASGIEQRASRTLVAYGRSGPVASAQTLGNIDKDVGDRSSIPSKALRSHGESSRARHDAGARRAECGAQDRAPFQAACRRAAGAARSRFPSKHKVIFVHGCFWHRHTCKRGTLPASNVAFWQEKLERNKRRDREAMKALTRAGWRVMVVWECETRDAEKLRRRLDDFLSDATTS